MKIGIAISTYTEEKTDSFRYNIIERSLTSLQNYIKTTNLNIYIVVVIDGKIPSRHQDLLKKYNFNIYQKEKNGGVARIKNTSIRLLLEQNIDYGFLMDDDVEYKEGCFEKYVDTMIKTKLDHFGFCQLDEEVIPRNIWKTKGYIGVNINGCKVLKHKGRGVGCLLSFTPELIHKIGYFKVMPGKYGYEHINFTYRVIEKKIIPHAVDIIDSHKYIKHIGFEPIGINQYRKNHSISETYRKNENKKNKNLCYVNLDKFEECIE